MTETHLQLRVLPAQDPGGHGQAARHAQQLAQLNPEFFSVTFGAGGSTRDRTLETVLEIQREGHQGRAAPVLHRLDAGKHPRDPRRIQGHGIRHIVALRGDLPSGMA